MKLTVKRIRINNQLNALSAIAENDGITRHDLAKLNDVSLMTITNVVEDLLHLDVVYEKKVGATIGRSPSNLYMKEDLGVLLGIDLTSHSKAAYVFYSLKKNLVFQNTFAFNQECSYTDNLNALLENIKSNLPEGEKMLGIGISAPGAYIPQEDRVVTSLIKEQQSLKLRKIFNDYFKCENIVIDHDVNMAAYAESLKLPKAESLYYMFIGEGVGGSTSINKKIYKGYNLLAGDVGQNLVGTPEFPELLENVVSITAIERYAKAKGANIGIDEIIQKYREGDERFVAHIDYVLATMSTVIYNLLWQINPNFIIIKSPSKVYRDLIIHSAKTFIESRKKHQSTVAVSDITTTIAPSFIDGNSSLDGLYYKTKMKYLENLCSNR